MKKSILPWLALAGAVLAALVLILVLVLARPQSIIGICYRENTAEENRAARASLEQRLKAQGYQVMAVDADGDQAKQIEQLSQLQKGKCRGLLVEPVMSSAAEALLTALTETGLPAVLFGTPVEPALLAQHPGIAWVGVDNSRPGALQGQLLSGLPEGGDLNGDGVVSCVVLQGPENHMDAAASLYTLKKALEDSPFETRLVCVHHGDWSRDVGKKQCKAALAEYGKDIEVVFCGNAAISRGALDAITDGGRTVGTDIYLIGMGENAAEQWQYSAMVYLDRERLLQTVSHKLTAMLEGTPTEQITVLDHTVLTH